MLTNNNILPQFPSVTYVPGFSRETSIAKMIQQVKTCFANRGAGELFSVLNTNYYLLDASHTFLFLGQFKAIPMMDKEGKIHLLASSKEDQDKIAQECSENGLDVLVHFVSEAEFTALTREIDKLFRKQVLGHKEEELESGASVETIRRSDRTLSTHPLAAHTVQLALKEMKEGFARILSNVMEKFQKMVEEEKIRQREDIQRSERLKHARKNEYEKEIILEQARKQA